jgi:hypothetical protein
MKKIVLPISFCVIAVVAALYYLNSGGNEERRSTDAAPAQAVEPTAVDANTAAHTNTPANSAEEAAPAVMPAPKREAGALTDALPVGVARVPGNPLVATVLVDAKRTPELLPNQVGEFPRVYIKPGQKVQVRLRFPNAEAGARASVSVEDGGFLADKKPALPLTLDAERVGEFEFTAGMEPGQYRVSVRQGADTRILVLWAEA